MIKIAVVTVSDSAVAGTREDRSGPALRDRAQALGWVVGAMELVADDSKQIADILARLAGSGEVAVILTTGGTGVALRDITPEATRTVIEREIPGLGELMRAEGRKFTPTAVLSRGLAGVRGPAGARGPEVGPEDAPSPAEVPEQPAIIRTVPARRAAHLRPGPRRRTADDPVKPGRRAGPVAGSVR